MEHKHEWEMAYAVRNSWEVSTIILKCKDYNCEEIIEKKFTVEEVLKCENV